MDGVSLPELWHLRGSGRACSSSGRLSEIASDEGWEDLLPEARRCPANGSVLFTGDVCQGHCLRLNLGLFDTCPVLQY